jgi:acetylornithine deacetylase
MDEVRLARALIDIPSPTGDEGRVGGFLDEQLTAGGFLVERQEVGGGRFNLVARAGGTPRVVLCSHIDTVPPFFPSGEDDAFVYGRGACDTKGIIAAMLVAARELAASGVRDFALLLVVGEETDSIGAKHANAVMREFGSEYVIVGEPTGSQFVRATKGACTALVRFRGVAAHSAHPEKGDSAILKLARAVEEIAAASWGEDEFLGRATANVGVVRGGEKANIIPAEAEAEMIFRTVGAPEEVLSQLRAIVEPLDGAIVRSHGNPPAYMAYPAEGESTVAAFNTDAPHLKNLGVPILFGPGSILDAHTSGERISKSEMKSATATYKRLVTDLLGGSAAFVLPRRSGGRTE